METVPFTCGHCNNLMAVTPDLLGQQVRCPHCEQVVVAPAPMAPPPPPEPETFSFPAPEAREDDSIFGPKEAPDALFDEAKPATLEVPPEPPALEPVYESPPGDGLVFGAAVNHTADGGTASHPGLEPALLSDHSPLPEAETPAERPPARRPAGVGSTAAFSVLIFLVPYSIFMTCVAVYFYWKVSQTPPHPLEFLPDWPGENPGTTHKGQQSKVVFDRWQPEAALPARLRVGLHHTLRVGSLEVTPEKVERRPLVFRYDPPTVRPETSAEDALVLTLRLKNVSADESFYPTDPAFTAHWEKGQPHPYTFLEVGKAKFFGGPIKWGGKVQRPTRREYVEGQERDGQPLDPGEGRETVICTDPDDRGVLQALAGYQGPLLWRVQLRRGLARYKDREVSVAAVVGVAFAPADVVKVR